MRSYGQYCALAKGLDVVGDRWTLLIIRELLLRGPSRYTDLRNGLPGIATNLLAERLRQLEDGGLLAREAAPPPVATTLFSLTERGRALGPVLQELGRWAIPYMADGPAPGDEFRSHWLAWPAELFLEDREPGGSPLTIELDAGGEPLVLHVDSGEVTARAGRAESPDAVLSGDPHAVLGLLSGALDLEQASARGVRYDGDPAVLERLQPVAPA